jgi:hypothetical protein
LSKFQLKMPCPEELCINCTYSGTHWLQVGDSLALTNPIWRSLTLARANSWGIKFPFPFNNMWQRVAERTEIWYTLHEAGWGSKSAGSAEWDYVEFSWTHDNGRVPQTWSAQFDKLSADSPH